jgi:AcrR family transcriptional regulator
MKSDDLKLFGELFKDQPEGELTERQWQILDAAVQVFAEKGYDASRTSDIAKRAEVAEGTIFRYFNTKKDILIGLLFPLMVKVLRPMMMRSIERIMENKEDRPLEEVVKGIFLDRIQLARKNQSLLKTIAVESIYHPELLKPLQEEVLPKIVALVEAFITRYVEKEELKDLDPRLITRTVMSMVLGYLVLTSLFPNIFQVSSDEEEAVKMADILLNGILKEN